MPLIIIIIMSRSSSSDLHLCIIRNQKAKKYVCAKQKHQDFLYLVQSKQDLLEAYRSMSGRREVKAVVNYFSYMAETELILLECLAAVCPCPPSAI